MILRALVLSLVLASIAAGQDPAPPAWKKCGSEIAWMTDSRPLKDNNPQGRLQETSVDLEDLWSDVKAKAQESGRLILWYIPKVAGSHMYRDAILDHYMNVAVWSDEAIVNLVNRRFVPLRAACAKELKDETKVERWRVVEPAIVILDADGKELHYFQRIRTFNADYIAGVLRGALVRYAKDAAPAGASGKDLLDGGWLDAAASKLGGDPVALAELHRRQGRLDDALKLCDAAAKGGAEVAAVRGRTLLSAGRFKDAEAELAKSKSPEAAYFLGHAQRALRKTEAAAETWARLAESSPDTRWGWRASANVTMHNDLKPYGPAAVGFEEVVWVDAPAAEATTTRWARAEKDAADISKRAVAWLLRNQSSSGSWNDSRYAFWPSPELQPNVHMAVTGLAAAALLEWRDADPAGVDAAVTAAEAYLGDEKRMARGRNEECYADAYRLLYYVRKQQVRNLQGKEREANVERMNALVASLAAIQAQDGFWAHEYPNSFCTAAVLQALLQAKRCGATVGDKILSAGADALKSNRDKNNRYGYDSQRKGPTAFSSSGRNAMGEGVLVELKATEPATYVKAMEEFWEHLDRRENVRVCDFHSDQEMAGFFFFNNMLHTSETFGLLEGTARAEAASKMRAHLVKIPEIDGSFIDSHEMGKSYGTAAALLALKNSK
jgi:hypothetical protein